MALLGTVEMTPTQRTLGRAGGVVERAYRIMKPTWSTAD
jgi:hypothetical protein